MFLQVFLQNIWFFVDIANSRTYRDVEAFDLTLSEDVGGKLLPPSQISS